MMIDIFGIERARTWEPTLEAGDFYLNLTASCIRVAALVSFFYASLMLMYIVALGHQRNFVFGTE